MLTWQGQDVVLEMEHLSCSDKAYAFNVTFEM